MGAAFEARLAEIDRRMFWSMVRFGIAFVCLTLSTAITVLTAYLLVNR